MVRFVHDKPVRVSNRGPHLLNARKQLIEKCGTILHSHSKQVDDRALFRLAQQTDNLLGCRFLVGIAQADGLFQIGIIAFRIQNAELIAMVQQALHHARRQRRFAAMGRSCQQHVDTVWLEKQFLPVFAHAKRNVMAIEPRFHLPKVGGDEPFHQLRDARAMIVLCSPIGALFNHRQRIRDGERAFTQLHEGMIILRIADPHHIVR